MKKLLISSLFALASTAALNVAAAPVDTALYPGSGIGPGGVPVSAEAQLTFIGDQLTITLTNTSPSNSGQDVPGSTLTGFFWKFKGSINPTLTPVSAMLGTNSSIVGNCSQTDCTMVKNLGG